MRHAQADQVTVTLSQSDNEIHLTISDNGKGFRPDKLDQKDHLGFGLLNMRERIELLNGTFHIDSKPQKGTLVKLMIPYKLRANDEVHKHRSGR